jgi:GNAT superfamily N-acetyltransferase
LADDTGIFKTGEAQDLLGGVLDAYYAGLLEPGHEVFVATVADSICGWVYFSPSFKADGIWDLWWIGVAPSAQKKGIGSELLAFVENFVRDQNARLLIIETSSTLAFEPVRQFYVRKGYLNCGTIPDFYAEGDDKVTFAKKLR